MEKIKTIILDTRGNSFYWRFDFRFFHDRTKQAAMETVNSMAGKISDKEFAYDEDFGYITRGVARKLRRFISRGEKGVVEFFRAIPSYMADN